MTIVVVGLTVAIADMAAAQSSSTDLKIVSFNIRYGSADSDPNSLVNANGTLYFSADDGVHGRELWKSNGTAAGTVLVRDLYTGMIGGLDSGGIGGLFHSEIVAIGSTVYFAGSTALTGKELYKSNGTSSGTTLVRDVYNPLLPITPES